MARKPHPFDKMGRTEEYHERMAARSDAAFEEGKVNYLFAVFKMNARLAGRRVRDREEADRGRPDLTLRAFNDEFESFPLLLGASRLGGLQLHLEQAAFIPALFKAFGRAPFVTAYERFYEAAEGRAGGRPVGLVFPRKGFKNGMVVYAADTLDAIPVGQREAVLVYTAGTKKHRQYVLVRSFQRTLEAIHAGGHGWRPDGEGS